MVTIPSATKPLHVERIFFTDGTIIFNADVFLFNGFLIVDDHRHAAPTWYNLDSIDRLEGVTDAEVKQHK